MDAPVVDTTHQETSRKERMLCLEREYKLSSNRSAIPIKEGKYLWGEKQSVIKHEDGSITFSKGMYADDIAAFLLSTLNKHFSSTNQEKLVKHYLASIVNTMDKRAVQRHGYGGNPKEAALEWVDVNPVPEGIADFC